MIKPSGSEQIVGLVQGDRILIESKDMTRMYRYQLGSEFAELIESPTSRNCSSSLKRTSRPPPRACWTTPPVWCTARRSKARGSPAATVAAPASCWRYLRAAPGRDGGPTFRRLPLSSY